MKTMMNEAPNEIFTTNSRRNYKMKKFTKIFKNEKGLTLIELLAVIVILAIVAAIAVPSIGGVIENSKYSAVKADAITAINASQLYFTDYKGSDTSVNIKTLVEQGYLETQGKLKDGGLITKAIPHELTSDAIPYSGTKTIKFTNASISEIDADANKGSGTPPVTGFLVGNN